MTLEELGVKLDAVLHEHFMIKTANQALSKKNRELINANRELRRQITMRRNNGSQKKA